MEQTNLMMTKDECEIWLRINSDKRDEVERTVKIRVTAPFLFGEDFLPTKWRKWMEEASFKIHKEKWSKVESVDVDEYDDISLLKDLVNLLTTQIVNNVVDFQRFMKLAVLMDKQTDLAKAKSLAVEEVSFDRLWKRYSPTEKSKTALMIVVFSYIQFAVETVKKNDHAVKMPSLHVEDQQDAEIYKNRGNEEFNKEHYSEAVKEYTIAIGKNRYSAVLYNNRCLAFLNMKKFGKASIDGFRALTLDHKSIKARYRYAQAMFELGYHSRSLQFLSGSLDQDPASKELEELKKQLEQRLSDRMDGVVDMFSSGSQWIYIDQHDLGPRAEKETEGKMDGRQYAAKGRSKSAKAGQVMEETVKKREDKSKVAKSCRELLEIEQELKQGSEALLEERGRHAFVHYKKAMDLVNGSSEKFGGLREEDYVTFLYAYGMACLKSGIDEEILDAASKFEMILKNHSRIRSPLPYYGLSFALYKQNKFSEVLEPLKRGVHMAEHFPIAVETWPGTKHKITETEKGQMKIALQKLEAMSKEPPPPDAICRLSVCPQKPEMYLTDVGFRGYVKVVCRERCSMDYHDTCWKKIKAEEYPEVTHERELLAKPCRTPDCDGVYISVTVFGPDGLPKTEDQLEEAVKTKEKKNKGASKSQPKKNHKQRKQEASGSKQKQGKGESNMDDETTKTAKKMESDFKDNKKSKDKKLEGDQTEIPTLPGLQVPQSVAMDAVSVASSNTADGDDDEDFEDVEEMRMGATYILKKDDLTDEQAVKPGKSKSKKKKGKDKTAMPIEVKFTDASQRQMFSSQHFEDNMEEFKGARSYSLVDPNSPFSVPTYLQGAVKEFSREFKMSVPAPELPLAYNLSEEEKSQIAALHMHFEEVLQRLGPVSITDSRLGDELQQLPSCLQSVIERHGGLQKFLLQSKMFLMIEDHLCVVADREKCQELVAKTGGVKAGSWLPVPGTKRKKYPQDWNNSRANLAPEHFPNINEALAGDALQQKRKQYEATAETTAALPQPSRSSKLDTLEDIFVDTPDKGDNKMQAIIIDWDGSGTHKDNQVLKEQPRGGPREGTELQEDVQSEFHRLFPVESSNAQTLFASRTSILNSIFFPHRVANESQKQNIQSMPLLNERKPSETDAARINSMPPDIGCPQTVSEVDKPFLPDPNTIFRACGTSDLSVDARPFIPLNHNGFKRETKSKFTLNDYVVDKPVNPSEGSELASAKMEPSVDPNRASVGKQLGLEASESGFYSSSSSEKSSEDSGNLSSGNPQVDHLTLENVLDSVSSNSSQQTLLGGTCAHANNVGHADLAPSEESSGGQLNQDMPSNQTYPTSDTIVAEDFDGNPKMAPSGNSNDPNGNPGTSETPLNKPQSNIVTSEMYQNLWTKYKMLFDACKVYSDRRKNMKSSWTQCSKTPVKSHGINTGPDEVLEESKANVQHLTMNLKDLEEKYSRLKDRYDAETAQMRDEMKRLSLANKKYEAEQSRFVRQLQDNQKSLEVERSHFRNELLGKDAQIRNLEDKITSLNEHLRSANESCDKTLQAKQSESDLWTAEKLKLEEALANVERREQALQKRCANAELSILQLRCSKDIGPIEAAIRECEFRVSEFRFSEFRVSSVQNTRQKTPSLGENGHLWEKCLKENKSLLAFQKGQYEELAQRVKSGTPLNQLKVPKPVQPVKHAGKTPPQIPPNFQLRGALGVGMPFGARMNAPGVASASGLNQQMQQPPTAGQTAAKMVSAVGSGHPTDPQPPQQHLRPPTPPSMVPVSMASGPQAAGLVPGAARSKESTLPNHYPNAQSGVFPPGAQGPVSLAQLQAGSQQPPSITTTAARMQNQGLPQPHTQAVRQPSMAVTSVTNSGHQQVPAASFQNNLLSRAQNTVTPSPQLSRVGATLESSPTPPVSQPKSNFEKIIFPLQNMFPKMNKVQLTTVIREVRAANKGSLSGLSIEEIIHRATEVILSRKPSSGQLQTNYPQAGRPAVSQQPQPQPQPQPQLRSATSSRPSSQPAWKPVKMQPVAAWGLVQSENIECDDEEDPCVICHEEMITDTISLSCGHKFHPACIKLWLQEQRTCPTCRNYTLLPDEYPAPKCL